MKKKVIISIFVAIFAVLGVLVITSLVRAQLHDKVNNSLIFTFSEGDSFSNITSDFQLPLSSEYNPTAILTWESENSKVLEILEDNYVVVTPNKDHDVYAYIKLSIKLHNKTVTYRYTFIVKKA